MSIVDILVTAGDKVTKRCRLNLEAYGWTGDVANGWRALFWT
ncbi:hypothetical protein C8E05_0843 [Rhodococcus wratislaviensis]|uniref:Uncharacterized protein n=1 Tax=Rhodococcus wratislaviensis TaxID=44752 RepID=A0AB38FNF4_RHOWR|nr:hypothetical protein C8E05_0843 [Rhodococcus wratislaviensis]SPZ43184.1 Uncharacterised protein [Rhodococcus wratislaviensis]